MKIASKMTMLMALILGLSGGAQADELEVVLNGTHYTCTSSGQGGGNGRGRNNCGALTAAFEAKIKGCLENYTGAYEKAGACIPKEWAALKAVSAPDCTYAASQVCESYCLRYYNGPYQKTGYCSNMCAL